MKYQSGNTLIEILIAISVIGILSTVVTTVVLTSLSNVSYSKNQNLATQYAQQGMEIMRHMRDTDYGTFKTLTNDYCLAQSCSTLDSSNSSCWQANPSCPVNVSTFIRDVNVVQNSSNCNNQSTEVKVTVSWSDGKCKKANFLYCEHVVLTTCFSNYNIVPSP